VKAELKFRHKTVNRQAAPMIDSKKIEEIAKQISDSIPPGVRDMADNMEQRVKLAVQQQLSKLDVVSREELEVQQQMVLKLRERVQKLEQRLDDLESSGN